MTDGFGFVDELAPGIRWDGKYATWDNFTGKPVDGYLVNRIVGTRELCAPWRGARRPPPLGSGSCCGTAIARSAPSTLPALGPGAGGRPDEASATTPIDPPADVREGVRRHQVRPQPGQHRRPDPLSTWPRVSSADGRRPRPDGRDLPPRRAGVTEVAARNRSHCAR